MASSSLLSLSVLVLLFSISSAYTGKWSLPNGQNPIKIIEAAIGVSEDLLNANGMEAINNQQTGERQTIVVGPWGEKVDDGVSYDDGAYTGIRDINFEYDTEAIGGIQVNYDLNGALFEGEKHPSFRTGFTPVNISLDFPSEFITEVSGYTGNVHTFTAVRSLTFKTNKKTYGPYGVTSGTPFNLPIENGLIVGFKGSVGDWLFSIGFHLAL